MQANPAERRLSDALLADEEAGRIIGRAPALVGCVSNFSNFDLRASRSATSSWRTHRRLGANTTQHMYRWAVMLTELAARHGLDAGMVTYLSADYESQARLFAELPRSPGYFTCSRTVAHTLKSMHERTIASTGGPNTLVSTELSDEVAESIRMSASIENAGQCTALRHAVVPSTASDVDAMFAAERVTVRGSARDALSAGEFASVFDFSGRVFQREDGYTYLGDDGAPIAYRHSATLPPESIDEHWRQVYADVTSPDAGIASDEFVGELSQWLVKHQPISLAVCDVEADYGLALRLFERTGQVVYTVGCSTPALTVAARPQDGEIFGEFPVRREMRKTSKYPVVVPSPTPMYNSTTTSTSSPSTDRRGAARRRRRRRPRRRARRRRDRLRRGRRRGARLRTRAPRVPRRRAGAELPAASATTLYGLQTPPRRASSRSCAATRPRASTTSRRTLCRCTRPPPASNSASPSTRATRRWPRRSPSSSCPTVRRASRPAARSRCRLAARSPAATPHPRPIRPRGSASAPRRRGR